MSKMTAMQKDTYEYILNNKGYAASLKYLDSLADPSSSDYSYELDLQRNPDRQRIIPENPYTLVNMSRGIKTDEDLEEIKAQVAQDPNLSLEQIGENAEYVYTNPVTQEKERAYIPLGAKTEDYYKDRRYGAINKAVDETISDVDQMIELGLSNVPVVGEGLLSAKEKAQEVITGLARSPRDLSVNLVQAGQDYSNVFMEVTGITDGDLNLDYAKTPKYEADSGYAEIATEVGDFVITGLTGTKLLSSGVRLVKPAKGFSKGQKDALSKKINVNNLLSNLYNSSIFTLFGVQGLDIDDIEPVVLDKVPVAKDIFKDNPEDSEAYARLRDRTALFIDAMILEAGAGAVFAGMERLYSAAAGFTNSLRPLTPSVQKKEKFYKEQQEEAQVGGILDKLTNAFEMDGPVKLTADQRVKVKENVVDILRSQEGRTLVATLSKKGREMMSQELNTLEVLVKSDNITETQVKEIARLLLGASDVPAVQSGVSQTSARFKEELKLESEALGGTEATKDSIGALTEAAQAEVSPAISRLKSAEQTIDSLEEEIKKALVGQSDEISTSDFQTAIALREEQLNLPALRGAEKDANLQAAVSSIKDLYRKETDIKNELFDKIEGGDTADMEFVDRIKILLARLGDPDITGGSLVPEATLSPFEKLKKAFSRRQATEEIPAETDEEYTERVLAYLRGEVDSGGTRIKVTEEGQRQPIDLAYLYTKIRPELAAKKEVYARSTDQADIAKRKQISEFFSFLDEELELLAQQGDEVGLAAREAMDNFKDYAQIWESSPFAEISSAYNQSFTLLRRGDETRQPSVLEKDAPGFVSQASNTLLEVFGEAAPDRFVNLVSKLEEKGTATDSIWNYVYADALEGIDSIIRSEGELSSSILQEVFNAASKYGSRIKDLRPDQFEKINQFTALVGQKDLDKTVLLNKLNDLRAEAELSVQRELDGALQAFLKSDLPKTKLTDEVKGVVPKDFVDVSQTLASMFKSKDGRLEAIVDRAMRADDPRVLEGLQAEYLKNLSKVLFRPGTVDRSGAPDVSVSALTKADEGLTPYFDNLKVVFPEEGDKALVDSIIEVAQFLNMQKRSFGRAVPPGQSATFYAIQAKSAAGDLVRFTLGPLNSLGTKINAFVSNLVKGDDAKFDFNEYITGRIFNNPDEFIRIADRVIDKDKKAIRREAIADYLRFLVPPFLYGAQEEEVQRISEDVYLELMQESMKTSTTDQQTEELLQE